MNITISKISPKCAYYKTAKKNEPVQNRVNTPCSFLGLYEKQKIQISRLVGEKYFSDFLDKKHKVTKEEYDDVIKNHPSTLILAQEYCKKNYGGVTTPKEMAGIVLKIDKYLKNNCQNYRIISLGTSPACIAEQLANLGNEVIFLPVSGLSSHNTEYSLIEELPDLRILMEYLENKNIDDGKMNIVLDYTATGRSLRYITETIREYFSLGIRDIESVSLTDLLNKSFKNSSLAEKFSKNSFFDDVAFSYVGEISNVAHFPITQKAKERYKAKDHAIYCEDISKDELFKKFDEFSRPLARAYSLCVLHEIDKLKQKNSHFIFNSHSN